MQVNPFDRRTRGWYTISLDTIRVTGRNACRASSDSSAAVFALWEQARIALTATQLTSGGRGVDASIVAYDRTISTSRDRVLRQTSTIVSGFTRGLWRSRPAELLRTAGFPDGVFQLLLGDGETGAALVGAGIDKI